MTRSHSKALRFIAQRTIAMCLSIFVGVVSTVLVSAIHAASDAPLSVLDQIDAPLQQRAATLPALLDWHRSDADNFVSFRAPNLPVGDVGVLLLFDAESLNGRSLEHWIDEHMQQASRRLTTWKAHHEKWPDPPDWLYALGSGDVKSGKNRYRSLLFYGSLVGKDKAQFARLSRTSNSASQPDTVTGRSIHAQQCKMDRLLRRQRSRAPRHGEGT